MDLVQSLSSSDLLQKLKQKGVRSPDISRALGIKIDCGKKGLGTAYDIYFACDLVFQLEKSWPLTETLKFLLRLLECPYFVQ